MDIFGQQYVAEDSFYFGSIVVLTQNEHEKIQIEAEHSSGKCIVLIYSSESHIPSYFLAHPSKASFLQWPI